MKINLIMDQPAEIIFGLCVDLLIACQMTSFKVNVENVKI